MSTRCTIGVHDDHDSFYIYRHCDGYPHTESGVLLTLPQALGYAWKLPRFEAADFAAAIIRAWKDKAGGNIYVTTGHDAHYDTEFTYDVRCEGTKPSVTVTELGSNKRQATLLLGEAWDALED